MGNEPGKESLENGHGNDSNRKKTGKRSKKEGMHIESRPHEGRRTFKKVDDTVLGHPLNDDIEKYYTVTDKILGMGNFSVVKLGIQKSTNERCAIKIVDKLLVKNKPDMLANEIDILLRVNHPHIIGLKDLFDYEDKMMLCMELISGGELFDRIVEREQFSEAQAACVMRQLFDAISFLHELGIVHRDLKPENLLLANEKEDNIKIADFGLSKIYTEETMSTACGTPGYVAPEILFCDGYDKQIDIWSAGVIMYILLCGYPPFYNENEARLFDSIMEGKFEFHSPYWDHISPQAKDLIMKLLVVNPQQRLSAKKALKHEWFTLSHFDNSRIPEYKESLIRHNTTRKASMAALKANVSTNNI